MEKQSEYLPLLLQIIHTPTIDNTTRTAAAIRFRRFILFKWSLYGPTRGEADQILPNDRALIRAQLIPAIIAERDSIIQGLLISTVFHVARADYPSKWNIEAVGPISVVLQQAPGSHDPQQLFGALSSLYHIMKVRRAALASDNNERQIQADLVNNTAPHLLTIFYTLLQQEEQCIQHGSPQTITQLFSITHICCKILSVTFQQVTLPFYKQAQNVNNVTQCLIQAAKASHREYALTLYNTQSEGAFNHPLYKRRKWAFRVLARLVRGVLQVVDRQKTNKALVLEQVKWNQAWQQGFSEPLLQTSLNALFEFCIPGYSPTSLKPGSPPPTIASANVVNYRPTMSAPIVRPILRSILFFIEQKGKKKSLFSQYIQPHMRMFLRAIVSCYSLQRPDLEQLEDNPPLFIETILNAGLVDGMNDANTQLDEILTILFVKKKQIVSEYFLEELINKPLLVYQKMREEPLSHSHDEQLYAMTQKDAAMRIFGITRIFNHPDMLSNTFAFIQSIQEQHLVGSPRAWPKPPLLELRSLWCIQRFYQELSALIAGKLQIARVNGDGTVVAESYAEPAVQVALKTASQCVSLLVPDAEMQSRINVDPTVLALRIQAASTLDMLLNIKQVRDAALPFSSQLFSSSLELLESVDNERLSVLFQRLLYHYQDHVFPFAITILQRLVQKFMTLVAEDNYDENQIVNFADYDDDDDNDASEKYWAAIALLTSMHTVVVAVSDEPTALHSCEELLIPLCAHLLDQQLSDYVEQMLTIVQCLTYYTSKISQQLWELYPKVMGMLIHGWGSEHLEPALPLLANYFSKGSLSDAPPLHFVESDGKTITTTNPTDLLYRLVFEAFDNVHYNSDVWRTQESCVHLLRSFICWLPSESQNISPHEINSLLSLLVPKLITQITTALAITPHPKQIEQHRFEIQRAIDRATDPAEKQRLSETAHPLKTRVKYTILILDCIQALVFKYPSTLISLLHTSPPPAEVVQSNPGITSCLTFLLDISYQYLSQCSRPQSLNINVIGLSTILQWFGRVTPENDNNERSTLRTNIVSCLFSAMLRIQENEENEEDEDEDDQLLFSDYEDELDGDDDDDDDAAAELELANQQQRLQHYADLAQAHQFATHDMYFNDYDFVSPLDHVNLFELFVVTLEGWTALSHQFVNRVENETTILNSLADIKCPAFIENFHPILRYAEESRQLWNDEHAQEEEEYQLLLKQKQDLRQQQISQMRGSL